MLPVSPAVLQVIVTAFVVTAEPKRIKNARHALRNRLQILNASPSIRSSEAETIEAAIAVLVQAEACARMEQAV
ncbi:hypothetical protein [Methylocaldum sp.]|uniref:hypothetical protein n=1 Tax=Methylocaldum sp. TaxID=1969727 RepID=UPI002D4AB24D|nr:hypothetical protein [Methylocaldum sp.]HYE38202.1 hypothetical protein [Methylocaldum sp.]